MYVYERFMTIARGQLDHGVGCGLELYLVGYLFGQVGVASVSSGQLCVTLSVYGLGG